MGMDVPWAMEQGILLLGAPIGSMEFCRKVIESRMAKVVTLTQKLSSLRDSQLEFLLLRSGLSLPKVAYILRMVEMEPFVDILQQYDCATRDQLERIIASPISDDTWEQIKLRVSDGGLGIRATVDHARAAYCASKLSTLGAVKEILGLDTEEADPVPHSLLDTLAKDLEWDRQETTAESLQDFNQRYLSLRIDLKNLEKFNKRMEDQNERERARVKQLSIPYAGAWLTAIPIPYHGTAMCTQDFALACRLRLGLDVDPPVVPSQWVGPNTHEEMYRRKGDFAMCNPQDGGWTARHNLVRDAVHELASKAKLGPKLKKQYLVEDSAIRPADIWVPSFPVGVDTCLDVGVVYPLQKQHVRHSARDVGYSVTEMRLKKLRKYQGRLLSTSKIQPMIFDALGGWDADTVTVIKKMVTIWARDEDRDEKLLLRKFTQMVAVLIQQGNSWLLKDARAFPDTDYHEDAGSS